MTTGQVCPLCGGRIVGHNGLDLHVTPCIECGSRDHTGCQHQTAPARELSTEHPPLPGGLYLTESSEGYRVLVTDGRGWWKDCTDEPIKHDLKRYWEVGDLVHTTDLSAKDDS